MSSEHLQDSAERDQLWASLRGLRPELERLSAGELDDSERQKAMTILLARIVLLELQFRADDAGGRRVTTHEFAAPLGYNRRHLLSHRNRYPETSLMLCRSLLSLAALVACSALAQAEPTMKALIVDGQNNHGNWPTTTKMMKKYLEDTRLFTVDVATTAAKGTDESFKPDFSKYNVVVSNYNGAPWPADTKEAFVKYMKGGGGLVVVHAANNAFGDWAEYNEMIGLGGWGGRNETSGPYVYLSDKGELVRNTEKGSGGHHGPQHDFTVIVRDAEHPITKGMPREWLHVKDELYDKLRGPGTSMHILATAFADPKAGGSGRHEPMIFTVDYGKGRVFHTPMGHGDYSQECVGFITTLVRGTEWAATGKITLPIPADFPTADKLSQRKFE